MAPIKIDDRVLAISDPRVIEAFSMFSKCLLPIIARFVEKTFKLLMSEITDLTSQIRERDEQIISL